MIVSASRRTDIPAFFFPWFLDRLRKGSVEVANPFNPLQIRTVSLVPGDVDLFVFWTKNSLPMAPGLRELDASGVPFLILHTLTPYGKDLEPGLPPKESVLSSLLGLADRYGPERISWRYDPVILSAEMTQDYHRSRFEGLAKRLEGRVERCIVSFVAPYAGIKKNLAALGWRDPPPAERSGLIVDFAALAEARGMRLTTCAEPSAGNPFAGACIDGELASRIAGRDLGLKRDPHQRKDCLCAKSVDIGVYGTCGGGCVYCYAGGGRNSSPRPNYSGISRD